MPHLALFFLSFVLAAGGSFALEVGTVQPFYDDLSYKNRDMQLRELFRAWGLQSFAPYNRVSQCDLHGSQEWPGIKCRGAAVVSIDLGTAHAGFSGNLQAVSRFQQLETLKVPSGNLTGDLNAVSNLTNLSVLHLAHTAIWGDLGALTGLVHCRYLNLADTKISGGLHSLANLQLLRYLGLADSGIVAKFSSVNQLSLVLDTLDLANTLTSGDLSEVSNRSLRFLMLRDTRISGDLREITKLLHPTSFRVDLTNTLLYGDVQVMSNFTTMTFCLLGNTNISGNISHFAGMRHLQELSLFNTAVFGDMHSFPFIKLVNLERLELQGTSVSGVLGTREHVDNNAGERTLNAALHLRYLDISNTKATIFVTNRWWKSLFPIIEVLLMAKCHIAWELHSIEASRSRRAFAIMPELVLLDVSHPILPLNLSCSVFFSALTASGKLARINASGAGLYGEVPYLCHPSNNRFYGSMRSTLPICQSLVSVDLRNNSITMADLLTDKIQSVVLSENPYLRVASERLLTRPDNDGLVVDIRNTPVNGEGLFSENVPSRHRWYRADNRASFDWTRINGTFDCFRPVGHQNIFISELSFAPNALCQCLEGFSGVGAECHRCALGRYSDRKGLTTCTFCPANASSTPGLGETSLANCRPDPECAAAHLDCSNGVTTRQAKSLPGYVRLHNDDVKALKCRGTDAEAHERCGGTLNTTCGEGYVGTLCDACIATSWYRHRGRCLRCSGTSLFSATVRTGLLLLVVVSGGLSFCAWQKFRFTGTAKALVTCCVGQAPILFQYVQLISALSVLLPPNLPELMEAPVLRVVLFQAHGNVRAIRDAVRLDCMLGYPNAALLSSLTGPLILGILVIIALCASKAAGVFSSGIRAALTTTTVLFVGGVESAQYLYNIGASCVISDPEGNSLGDAAFFQDFPFILCSEGHVLGNIAMAGMVIHLLLVPACLFWVLLIQHATTRKAARKEGIIASTEYDGCNLQITLTQLDLRRQPRTNFSEERQTFPSSSLRAAAAGYSGTLAVQFDCCHVRLRFWEETREVQLNFVTSSDVDQGVVSRAMDHGELVALNVRQRVALSEVGSEILTGTVHLLDKYRQVSMIYFEIIMVFCKYLLVAISKLDIDTHTKRNLALGLCGVVAVLVKQLEPFAKHSHTNLSAISFLCLAVACPAFQQRMLILLRVTYVLPFLYASWFCLQPETSMDISLRIWETLKKSEEPEIELECSPNLVLGNWPIKLAQRLTSWRFRIEEFIVSGVCSEASWVPQRWMASGIPRTFNRSNATSGRASTVSAQVSLTHSRFSSHQRELDMELELQVSGVVSYQANCD